MKAARYYGPQDVRIEEVPRPEPSGPGEVVIRVEMAAVCGTDASHYTGATTIPVTRLHPVSRQQAPLILGHEMVGTIIEVGSEVRALTVGQRIVPGAGWWCGACEQCRDGRSNICQHTYLYGLHADGGLAEFVRLPAKMCVPVPQGCRLEAAVLAQPLAVVLHALDRADIGPFDVVALFGVGSIGALFLAMWEMSRKGQGFAPAPQSVVAIDINAQHLATAASLGVPFQINASLDDPVLALLHITEGVGVDIAIEATGDPTSIAQALASIKRGGRLLQVGLPPGQVPLPLGEMVMTEKELVPTNGQICQRDLPHALDVLAHTDLAQQIGSQIIDLEDLVEKGLRPLAEHRALAKIVVRIS
jgi:(R,R)-butanediol dehydrogenase / meso-butanediol dehydrogenase / diacetyl reductase